MLYVIDRFEGQWVVIEFDRKTFKIPKSLVPDSAREGDVISIKVTVDKGATKKAGKEAKRLFNDVFEGD